MTETTTSNLQFDGFPLWVCLVAAVLAFLVAFWVYRRETGGRAGVISWLLPLLRALAVLLCMLLLAEPVLRHVSTRKESSRLRFVIDGSRSMDVTDPGLSTARKLRLLASGGAETPAAGKAYLQTTDALRAAVDCFKSATAENLDLAKTKTSGERMTELEDGLARLSNLLPKAPGAGDTSAATTARAVVARFLKEEQQRQEDRWNDGREADEGSRRYYLTKAREALFRLEPSLKEISKILAADPETNDRLANLGSDPRWTRMQALLLGQDAQPGWIERLGEDHEIELLDLATGESWWWQRDGETSGELPTTLERPLISSRTDLAKTLDGIAGGATQGKGAVILLTDGNHNRAGSPEEAAGQLGRAGLPIHTLGFGADQPPPDLAVGNVTVPRSIYRGDRLAGRVAVLDTLSPGKKFRVVLEQGGEEVWGADLESTGEGSRLVPFEIPVNELLARADEDFDPEAEELQRNYPLALTARVRRIDGGSGSSTTAGDPALAWLAGNDSRQFAVTAVKRKRQVLVLDARPRWDLRYLKNHLERDPQWESVARIAMPVPGEENDRLLPASREELDQFDLVVVGDVPPEMLTEDERKWLAGYVAERGGGLIFVDGARNNLTQWIDDETLSPLLPVLWKENPVRIPVAKIRPSAAGRDLGALQWSASAAESASTWANLDPPQWIGQIEPGPGAETLLEAVAGEENHPVLVSHRYGAGKIVYLGFDESWRWRKGRDDDPQRRFWMQLADWAGEVPFAAETDTLSVGADRITLEEGGTTLLRARLRKDANSEGWDTDSDLEAVVLKDDEAYGVFPLVADPASGEHRGKTSALPAGKFEVRIRNRDTDETFEDAAMELFVAAPPDLEMSNTALNRSLLGSLSKASGGQFRTEEEAGSLLDQLEAMIEKVEDSRTTPLWRSWWVFLAIILLLALEWILRKRAGYV